MSAYGVAGLESIEGGSLAKSLNGRLGEEAKAGSPKARQAASREKLRLASRLSLMKVA